MHSKRRSPAFPSWLDQQPLWIERERYLWLWLARERSVALWMHRAAARAWVVRFLDAVSRIGEGDSETCPDAWFGLNLSDCTRVGEPVTVPSDPQGE